MYKIKNKKAKHNDGNINIKPDQIPSKVKEYILDICKLVLDHIYNRGSYDEFKKLFIDNLAKFLSINPIYEEKNEKFIQQFNENIEHILTYSAFLEDPYTFPLFILIFSLREGIYDSRNAVLLQVILQNMKLNELVFEKYENKMVNLISFENIQNPNKKFKKNKIRRFNNKFMSLIIYIVRYMKIAAATIIGGSLVGLTGGLLAAPFLAASIGTLVGSAWLTSVMGTAAGMGIIGSLFGVTGAALTGYKMNRRSGDIEEFSFQKIATSNAKEKAAQSLRITIAISGWISKDCNFATPWQKLRLTKERYVLCWEGKYLKEFGQGVNYVANWATGQVAQEILKETALAGVLSAISWPLNLLSLARVIDNPWAVAFARTKETGLELANVLSQRVAGHRPVNLIAFGLGSRVIYHALNALAKPPNESNRGIIQDVIIMGSPIPADERIIYNNWMDYIVAGKLINCYCERDWILKFLYRTSSAQIKIAGLEPIPRYDTRIYNINLTDIVEGHNDYIRKMPEILKTLGYDATTIDTE